MKQIIIATLFAATAAHAQPIFIPMEVQCLPEKDVRPIFDTTYQKIVEAHKDGVKFIVYLDPKDKDAMYIVEANGMACLLGRGTLVRLFNKLLEDASVTNKRPML